jgi:hypothetical protein
MPVVGLDFERLLEAEFARELDRLLDALLVDELVKTLVERLVPDNSGVKETPLVISLVG